MRTAQVCRKIFTTQLAKTNCVRNETENMVLLIASPVYFYSIDAQLKTLIDRTVARWTEVTDKEFYYIVTAADGEKEAAETTVACFCGYAECVEGAKEMGIIYLRYGRLRKV